MADVGQDLDLEYERAPGLRVEQINVDGCRVLVWGEQLGLEVPRKRAVAQGRRGHAAREPTDALELTHGASVLDVWQAVGARDEDGDCHFDVEADVEASRGRGRRRGW